MSSFIVSKSEFIKAAGLMCGYEQAKGRDSHKWFIDHVREQFENAYRLNVMSVNEQYGDNEMPDEDPSIMGGASDSEVTGMSGAELENRQRKFGMMMKPFQI